MTEGTLDIIWENNESPMSSPRYSLIFAPYVGFRSGAQQPKHIVGQTALGEYLKELGFTPEDAIEWLKRISSEGTVSIPHTHIGESFLTSYGY